MTTDQRAHQAAIRAAITANLGQWAAYTPDKVPSPAPRIYVVTYLTRRPLSVGGINAGPGISGWRLTTRYVGRTFAEAEWALAQTTEALEDQWLTVTAVGASNGLFPLDGVHDPWRWAPDGPWWVSPAYRVTWSDGDEVPAPTLPVGGEEVTIYVIDAATYLEARDTAASEDSTNDHGQPMVKLSDGAGIAFVVQAQPGQSDIMNAPPNPEIDVTTMLRGVPGLRNPDGVNDPWRWDDLGNFWWVGPAVEVTWSAGDEVPVPDLPIGGQKVVVYVSELTTYREVVNDNQPTTTNVPDDGIPGVKAADGSGIAFLVQAQPGFTEDPDEPFSPDLDVTTMLGDVTVGDPYPWTLSGPLVVPGDPWQWSDAWGGWVGPAYELTWLTGGTITPADIDLNYRIMVIEDPAPAAPDDSTYLTGWTTTHGLAPIVATAGGSGVGYVVQHEPGFTHTTVPDADVDPAAMFGDFTVGASYTFPGVAPEPYEWPGAAFGAATTTPIQFETEQPIAYDDGWYSGSTAWTYVL